jgi:hypothetical protein
MPAIVVVEGGVESGRSFQIEEEVIRVGRSPACQIALADPAAPETALAIRYQGGKYIVYNRALTTITVAAEPVAPGQSRQWSPGEIVNAWIGTNLRLVVQGDPAPARKTVVLGTRDIGTDQPAEKPGDPAVPAQTADKEPSPNKNLQIGVIVFTWIVILGVLAYSVVEEGNGPPKDDGYEQLVMDLDTATKTNPLAAEVSSKLKEAKTAERRGHHSSARKQYSEVVVMLRNRAPATTNDKDPLAAALSYARTRARNVGSEE